MSAAHSPLPACPLSGRKFRFSSRKSLASMHCLCRPAWGCFFLFCLSFYLSAIPSPAGRRTAFRSSGFSDSPSICSQLAHTSPTRLVTRFADVVPLPGPQNRTQGHTGASLVFLRRTSLPLPLKGEGLGIVCCLVRLVFSRREARCFSAGKDGYFVSEGFSMQLHVATAGHKRLTRLQQRPSGAALVSFPCLASKTGHRATQGRVWVHHFFLERFCPGRTAKPRSSLRLTAS